MDEKIFLSTSMLKVSDKDPKFPKPSKVLETREWIIGSTLAKAIADKTHRRYIYRNLIEDINSIIPDDKYLRSNVRIMAQEQYFSHPNKMYEILISKDVACRIISLLNLTNRNRTKILNNTRIFSYKDCIDKYNEFVLSNSANAVFRKIKKFEPQPYVGNIKTFEDVMIERANFLRSSEKATNSEKSMYRLLSALKVYFYFQFPCNIGEGYNIIMDFFIPSNNISIEIDGGYHNEPKMIVSDMRRYECCARLGILIVRFSNFEVLNPTMSFLTNLCKLLGCEITAEAADLCVSEDEYKKKMDERIAESVAKYNKRANYQK